MTTKNCRYYFAIAHRKNAPENLMLGHAGFQLLKESNDGETICRHNGDTGSILLPKYKALADKAHIADASKHAFNVLAMFGVTALASTVSRFNDIGVLTSYFAIPAVGAIGAVLYGGHKISYGAFRFEYHEPDTIEKAKTVYKIPITKSTYQSLVDRFHVENPIRDFSPFRKNCASQQLGILQDDLGIKLPVKRRWPLRVVNITTPRYVQRVAEALHKNGTVTEIQPRAEL